MPTYPLKCTHCKNTFEFTLSASEIADTKRLKCNVCETRRTFKRDWMAGVAAYHNRYSPKHPRVNRGRGY